MLQNINAIIKSKLLSSHHAKWVARRGALATMLLASVAAQMVTGTAFAAASAAGFHAGYIADQGHIESDGLNTYNTDPANGHWVVASLGDIYYTTYSGSTATFNYKVVGRNVNNYNGAQVSCYLMVYDVTTNTSAVSAPATNNKNGLFTLKPTLIIATSAYPNRDSYVGSISCFLPPLVGSSSTILQAATP